jgi:hypothetical protein
MCNKHWPGSVLDEIEFGDLINGHAACPSCKSLDAEVDGRMRGAELLGLLHVQRICNKEMLTIYERIVKRTHSNGLLIS